MKKWINLVQWVMLAGVVAGILWVSFRPAPPLDYNPGSWSNWSGFMTLSYAGVTRDDNALYPSSKTLSLQFEALQAAGYKTITPDDALAFLERRAPLPDKALLILFEGARKETFIRAHPILRRLGMRATLCIPTDALESWDESRLKERDIRKIGAMPQWSLASLGRQAVNPLTTSETGATDHFLSSRAWLAKDKRLETDAEFAKRLEDDYVKSAATMKSVNAGKPVSAYVYPFADDGNRHGADPLAHGINTELVATNYAMAFVPASNPYNAPGRNRYNLTRLRVDGDWSAAQVLAQLSNAAPLTEPVSGLGDETRWTLLNGARVGTGTLRMLDDQSAWLKGSDLWTDARVEFDIDLAGDATATVHLRYVDSQDGLRLTVVRNVIRLQEARNGRPVTLNTVPIPSGGSLRLNWFVKGTRTWLAINGTPVFGPVPVSEPRLSGMIGFECRGLGVAVSAVAITPIFREGLLVASWSAVPAARRERVTEYFPAFPKAGGELTETDCHDYISAAADGTTVWPILETSTNDAEAATRLAAVTAQVVAKDLRPFVKGFVLDSPSEAWVAAVRAQGFGVMSRVKTGRPHFVAGTAMPDYIWMDQTGPDAVPAVAEFLHGYPPTKLLARDRAIVDRFDGVGWISDEAVEQKGRP